MTVRFLVSVIKYVEVRAQHLALLGAVAKVLLSSYSTKVQSLDMSSQHSGEQVSVPALRGEFQPEPSVLPNEDCPCKETSKVVEGADDEVDSSQQDSGVMEAVCSSKSCAMESTTSEEGSAHASPKRKKMRNNKEGSRVRPNAFIAIRVPSWRIRSKLQELQEVMVESEPYLESSLVSLDKLHLTMMVLKLNEDETQKAQQVLKEITEKLKASFIPLKLEFSGIGHFRNNVVFAKVKEGPAKDRLYEIAGIVREVFTQASLPSTDDKPFQSHLTVAKMTAASREHKAKLGYKIPPHSYSSFMEEEFGEQDVEGLELLSMSEPVDDEGYYHCFQRCSFSKGK